MIIAEEGKKANVTHSDSQEIKVTKVKTTAEEQ